MLPKGDFLPALVLWTLFGMNMSVGPFLFRAIMADVADHDHVETGQARAGVYFALLALTNKLGYSVAIIVVVVDAGLDRLRRPGQQFARHRDEHDVALRRAADDREYIGRRRHVALSLGRGQSTGRSAAFLKSAAVGKCRVGARVGQTLDSEAEAPGLGPVAKPAE